jgi:hypothetical protein
MIRTKPWRPFLFTAGAGGLPETKHTKQSFHFRHLVEA